MDDLDSLRGFFEKLRPFARSAAEQTFPASAVTLTALREAKSDLAKRIFIEAVIVPAKAAIKELLSPATLLLFEEMESRFLQDEIVTLIHEVEVIVASRMISEMYVRIEPSLERFLLERGKDQQGRLTSAGITLLHWLGDDVRRALARLAALRERRVQLLLVAEITGVKAVESAADNFAGYKRGAVMRSIAFWLERQEIDDERRKRIASSVAEGSDEQMMAMLEGLEGQTGLTKDEIGIMVDEIFTGREHIEF